LGQPDRPRLKSFYLGIFMTRFAYQLPAIWTLRSALLAGFACAAGTAAAQTTPNGGLKDVVVTATRQVTKLQKTPVAVTVVSAKQIAEQNDTTARDLAGKTPGVLIQRSGITPLTEIFFVRGIGNSDPIFDPNVGQYVDDVYLPRAINGLSDLTDIERVEILRGPQGTLFGDNSDAGAIRYVTKDPTDKTAAKFDISGGNYSTLNAHGYVAGALVPGKLDGSIAFAHDQHDGYSYDPTISKHVNDQDTNGARAKLLATISPDLTVLFEADGLLDRSDTGYYSPLYPIIGGTLAKPVYGVADKNDSYASQEPLNHSWDGGVSLHVAYVIDPHLTVKSISAYRGFSQNPINYNNDGEPLVDYNLAYDHPVSISDNYIVYREQELTQEFQLQGNYDKFDFTSGLYLLHENFASNRIGYVVAPNGAGAAPAFPEDQIGDTKTTDYAAYTQGDYHFSDKLTGTLGGRYTIKNRDFTFQGVYDTLSGIPIPNYPANFTNAGELRNKTWYSFTPKYGVSYQFTPDFYGYGTISEGFNAGGFNNRASSRATALPYDEENVTTYEIGFKTDWLDHRLRLNPTLFYNSYQNLQQTATIISPITNTPVTVRTNAGSAHTDGFELESIAEPLEGLILTNNVSYLNTQYDAFSDSGKNLDTGAASATGNQLPFSPRWQLYSQAVYTIPLPVRGQTKIGADISYETAYYSDIFNYWQNRIGAQAFADAFVSYSLPGGHWVASVNGKNLFNRLQYQSLSWGGYKNSWEGQVSPPTTVTFKLSYTY
jgi:iron complex outermembrane receptor protein